jgi:hypothetical protein
MHAPKTWIAVSILLAFGCAPPAEHPPQSADKQEAHAIWLDIPETEDRMLITVGDGRQREAVVDVPWTQETRDTAVEGGFARGRDAHVTRALYRFDCAGLAISTRSYAVLSKKGETLTSRVFPKAKSQPAAPGSTAARYLVAGCQDELAPAEIKRLLGMPAAAPAAKKKT